jgi:hypothetical protein
MYLYITTAETADASAPLEVSRPTNPRRVVM